MVELNQAWMFFLALPKIEYNKNTKRSQKLKTIKILTWKFPLASILKKKWNIDINNNFLDI